MFKNSLIEFKKDHKPKFTKVLDEYMEICLIPDNMEMMKGLGVYSDIHTKEWCLSKNKN